MMAALRISCSLTGHGSGSRQFCGASWLVTGKKILAVHVPCGLVPVEATVGLTGVTFVFILLARVMLDAFGADPVGLATATAIGSISSHGI